MKRALVLGATGCMGAYLCPKLVEHGFLVDAVTLDEKAEESNIRYLKKDALNDAVLEELLTQEYDVIVDFMWYSSPQFKARMPLLLERTKRYFALSSYRVYADSRSALNEDSPRLLETVLDELFQASDDYAQAKCRIEDALKTSGKTNWTILRPVVVYGGERLPLVTVSASDIEKKTQSGKTVLLPQSAKDKLAAVIWAGDAAEMIARLADSKEGYGQTYLIGNAEQTTWGEIAKCYERLTGGSFEWVDDEVFFDACYGEGVVQKHPEYAWILRYDRFYNRKIDNAKVLKATQMTTLKSAQDALEYEWNKRRNRQ